MSARRLIWGLPALAAALLGHPAAAGAALHVIPFPRTPDASRFSHIIFSSLRPSELLSVKVVGSSSGQHTGHFVSLPDRSGTAFLPNQPFTGGERVRVIAMLSSPTAGTASGDPGATSLRFSFTVSLPPARAGAARAHRDGSNHLTATSRRPPTQSFHSAPSLHPPLITATRDPDRTSGDIFLTPTHTPQLGPLILDGRGRLVWFLHTPNYAANLEVQRYQDQPVLTWWQGASFSNGEAVIMNRSYRTVRILHGAEGYPVDIHDFQLTPQGTAFIDSYVQVRRDLSGAGGPKQGTVLDCLVQELDIRTGQLLWEWHALGHVPLSAGYTPTPYDFFHLNSIQQLPNGNLLVSARDTWSVYEIDKQTGRVIWTLGGRYSSFKMGPGTNFEWQHDAHLEGNTLSLFDDADRPQEERQSSAKVLRLHMASRTVSLIRRYRHSPPVLSPVIGSTQILPGGNVFVGWGKQPYFSEFTPSGEAIFNGEMPLGVTSYRAFRFPWHARPLTRPSLAVAPQGKGKLTLYTSWNGATEVSAWRVRGGSAPGQLRIMARVRRSGFETAIVLHSRPRYVAVQALSAHGKVLGTSSVHAVPAGS
jgi:Arylsulfotransferase (ASST)